MSETQTNLGEPVDPAPEPDEEKAAATGSGRFSAYDKRYLRYVGGVHDTKAAAKAAAKDAGVPASSTRVDEV